MGFILNGGAYLILGARESDSLHSGWLFVSFGPILVVNCELAASTEDSGAVGRLRGSHYAWNLVVRYQREEVAHCADLKRMGRSG